MLHVYEVEVFKDGDFYLAFPFDMDGGTQGYSIQEASEMAADWLQTEMEQRAMHDLPLPKATFGNEPQHGGERLLVAVNAGKDTVRRMTAAEAARRLGVTRGRVSQMVGSGLLETFELDGRRWVTEDSVNARLADAPKAGRPKREPAVA